MNSPPWLQGDTQDVDSSADPTQGAQRSAIQDGGPNNAFTPSSSVPAAVDEDESELPTIILSMRIANMGISIALVLCTILEIFSIPSLTALILAIYACCGGLLICCFETQLSFVRETIAVNFGFLFHGIWRFLFYLLLGSVAWSFGFLGKVVGVGFFAVACFNTFVLVRYKSYRRLREKIAREEDKRIEARINRQIIKQASSQLASS